MKKIAMAAVLLFSVVGSAFAQDEESYAPKFERGIFNHVAVNVGGGLDGISVGVAAPVTNFLEVEAGVSFVPKIKPSYDLDIDGADVYVSELSQSVHVPDSKVNAEADFSRTAFNLKASVYPFGGNSKFFVTAGLAFGGEKLAKVAGYSSELEHFVESQYPQYKQQILDAVGANLGGYNITIDDSYRITGDVRMKKVRPYLGLGFGRLVPKNRVGFRFEMGCQFMGKLKVYQNNNELKIDDLLKDSGSDDLSDIINKIKVYPVLKFSLVGRIL